MTDSAKLSAAFDGGVNPAMAAAAYWIDACQRSVLMLDTLRERGNTYLEQSEKLVPHVLTFETELILDGRELPRPVNYLLVRIRPPKDVKIDRKTRPFIVFDPRAGHGPGIGGMKQDSEIGVAMRAGHPCYFVGFLQEPVAGQTIEDVCIAEARFVERVIELEPDAAGKPCLIGNCQAGWQIAMMASICPDLPGPIILAGSPLSYWAGVRGKNPMRYLGGLLGGTWLTSLAGDLGNGIFDGANLVANFESLHPENTYLEKAYNVYSRIDTEPRRFLDFETWWGSPVLLEAAEMQWIADNLFVGNKLGEGAIASQSGNRVDLRNIASPIIVFCSWGDDITPPQQALGWLLDLYENVDDLIQAGQTVVYTVHETIGHLGIFVSGKVATKEHAEFTSCIDMIDLLPPGLYEAVISDAGPETARADLVEGKYLLALEPRTLDDIRAFGTNSPEDDAKFETVARVSEINKGLYQTYLRPIVRQMTTPASAQFLRSTHPHRLRFSSLSDRSPAAPMISWAAKTVRANRRAVGEENPLRQLEAIAASQMAQSLTLWGVFRDTVTEQMFLSTYSSPLLQAFVGLKAGNGADTTHVVRDVTRQTSARALQANLHADMEHGDLTDAIVRSVVYIAGGARGGADERSYSTLKRISSALPPNLKVGTKRFKESMRKQFLTLRLDESKAIETLPALLPEDAGERRRGLEIVRALFESRDRTDAEAKRFAEISQLFEPARVRVVRRSPAA